MSRGLSQSQSNSRINSQVNSARQTPKGVKPQVVRDFSSPKKVDTPKVPINSESTSVLARLKAQGEANKQGVTFKAPEAPFRRPQPAVTRSQMLARSTAGAY